MVYVYVALNDNNRIKIGMCNDITTRQHRFTHKAKFNRGMIIRHYVAMPDKTRLYAQTIEELLKNDLALNYAVTRTTMDTFKFDPCHFYPAAYIKAFDRKVAKAEKIAMRGL